MRVLLLAAVLVSAPSREGVRDIRSWPDDAVLAQLEASLEILKLAPWPHDTRVPYILNPAAKEAGRRRLRAAEPMLKEMLSRIPQDRPEPEPTAAGGMAVRPVLLDSLAALEVGTHEWPRLLTAYVAPLRELCTRQQDPKFQFGVTVLREMTAEADGRQHVRALVGDSSRCMRQLVAVALFSMPRPGPLDRGSFERMLTDEDEFVRAYAFRGLMRATPPAERAVRARAYLESQSSQRDETNLSFPRRVAAGEVTECEFLINLEEYYAAGCWGRSR